jgi:hypothetical protein
MPILCLVFASGYAQLTNEKWRKIAKVLVAISIFIHLLGVFGHNHNWYASHADGQGRDLFSFHNTQIEAHLRDFLKEIGIAKD